MKKIVFLLLIMLIYAVPAFCDNKADAVSTLENGLDSVQKVLDDSGITLEAKKIKLVGTVTPMFDFKIMSMLTLGKSNWIKLNAQQRKEFIDSFIKLLKKSFIDKVSLYKKQRVQFLSAISKRNKVKIPTIIISGENRINMDYKLYKSKNNGWLIYDVVIQNISVIDSYKGQVRSLMAKGGYELLIDELNKMVTK